MSVTADNPAEVISTLDSQLDHEVSLVVFGRGSLCLGYSNPPQEYFTTQDVDGIIRMSQLESLVNDESFWDAVDRTNVLLEPRGLYITHLFKLIRFFFAPTGSSSLCR